MNGNAFNEHQNDKNKCSHDQENHVHYGEHYHIHDHDNEMGHKIPDAFEFKNDFMSIYMHDMFVVGSIRSASKKSFEEAEKILEAYMKKVAESVTGIGGVIGHIKGFASIEGESCMMSISDEDLNKLYIKGKNANIESVAIVSNIEPDELKDIIEYAFHEFMAS